LEAIMTEDIAGVHPAATRHRYATCSECGNVFRSSSSTVSTLLEHDRYSDLSEVCPSCDALDRQGESVPRDDDY